MFRRRISLAHKIAIVTGGARGIGRAVAEALLSEGAQVALVDRDELTGAATAKELGRGCRSYGLDVTDLEAFEACVERVERELGPVDILVNNAGIMPLGAFLEQTSEADRLQIDVNLHGVIHGMRAVLPSMHRRGTGHVVNIASVAGRIGAPHAAVYSATKHAVIGLTEAVRSEYENTGLRFSYVMPALVDTELIHGTGLPPYPPPLTPAQVADAVLLGLHTGKVDIYAPRFVRFSQILPAILPRSLYEWIGKAFGIERIFVELDPKARRSYRDRILRRGPSEQEGRGPA